MNFKKSRKGYMAVFGGKEGRNKHCNYIINSKKIKKPLRCEILMVSFHFYKIVKERTFSQRLVGMCA